jgi:hypothetical protein
METRIFAAAVAWLSLTACVAQPSDPRVDRSTIFVESVEQGDFPLLAQGEGTLKESTVELRMPAAAEGQFHTGQPVTVYVDRLAVVTGKIEQVQRAAANGTIPVVVQLDAPRPADAKPGQKVFGHVQTGSVSHTYFVQRPVFAKADSDDKLLRVEGDRAAWVSVHYGHISRDKIEVQSGLKAGDKVITSDMSAYVSFPAVQLN